MSLSSPSIRSIAALRFSRSPTQRITLLSSVAILAALWLVPWTSVGIGPFAAHMIAHMGIVAVAAPLAALALAGSRFDPVARAPRLFPPIPVSLCEFVVVWLWHTPALHHAARHAKLALVAEQGLFLLAGLWLWLAVFGGRDEQQHSRAASGVAALLLTSMHMTLLGALLALAPRPLFAHEGVANLGAGTPDPLADQHLGGAIMLLVGGVSYLAGGLWLTAQLLGGRERGRQPLRQDSRPLEREAGL